MSKLFPRIDGRKVRRRRELSLSLRTGFRRRYPACRIIARDMITVSLSRLSGLSSSHRHPISPNAGRPKTIADLKNHNCIAYRLIIRRSLSWSSFLTYAEVFPSSSTLVRVITDPIYSLRSFSSPFSFCSSVFEFSPFVSRLPFSAFHLTQVLPKYPSRGPACFSTTRHRAALFAYLPGVYRTTKEVLRIRGSS